MTQTLNQAAKQSCGHFEEVSTLGSLVLLLIKNQKATMKNTYVYDTEGTGLQTRYDRPYQFAANLYGSNDNLIQTTNLRGRLPRYVLPDPEALLITGQSIKNIQSAPLSHYEFVERVHADIVANSPATVIRHSPSSLPSDVKIA